MDVIAGRISGGELAAFVFYSLIVGSAFGTLSEVIGELQRAAGAAERIAELLRSQNIIQPPTSDLITLPERVRGDLRLEGVRFSYPSRPESFALDGLDLTVNAGETLAWSDRPVRVSRRCMTCYCASTTRPKAGSSSTMCR